MRATLGLLEKLTLLPGEVAGADLAELRAEGLSDRAILDAAYVCVGFNIITRIANALGFKVPPEEVFSRASRYLTVFGYSVLSGFWSRRILRQLAPLVLVNKSAAADRDAFDPYDGKLALLRHSVLSEPGTLAPTVRQAICDGLELSGPLGVYVRKVVEHSHAVGDEDIAGLHRAGYTDDQIFEATVSAALGAGLLRLGRILRALQPAAHPADDAVVLPASLPQAGLVEGLELNL